MTNSSYTNAIVSERARFQQEFDTISRRDRTTGAPSFDSFLDREQVQESARKRHAEACATIIAQAYHDGDYDAFWRTLSKAARFDRNISRNTINSIARNTITLAGLRDHPINEAAIHGEWFTRTVHQDTSEETTSLSAGVYLLFDHLDDASNIITLSASAGKTSFMVAHNTVTLGVRVVEELTNSGITRHELLPRINRYTGGFMTSLCPRTWQANPTTGTYPLRALVANCSDVQWHQLHHCVRQTMRSFTCYVGASMRRPRGGAP